ncbi:MAG: O-antigen ligase family protein [Anaerolineales bacterium]|nr:O-antigen ligase family protein [Anaerolineales bacterium]
MVKTLINRIDRFSWLLLILATPFLLFPSPKRSLALLALPVIWFIGWLARGKPLPRTPLNPSLLLMAFMVLISLWATYDMSISLGKVCGVMLGIAVLFVFAHQVKSKRDWLICLAVLLSCGLGIAGISLLGTRWVTGGKLAFLTNITSNLPVRLTGLAGATEGFHPNEVAGALLWVLPLMLTVTIGLIIKVFFPSRDDEKINTLHMGALFVVTLAAIFTLLVFILTLSRTAYLALFIAIGILVWLILPRGWKIGTGILGIAALVIAGYILSTMDLDKINEYLFNSASGDSASSLNSMEGRLEIWTRAYECIQDFAYTGMGMNTFRTAVYIVHPPMLFNPDTDIGHAHNEFLQAALDLGVPGLLAFIWLYVLAFWQLFKSYRLAQRVDRNALPWVLGLAGGLIAHLLFGMNDAVALGAKPGLLFWMLCGLIASLPNWMHEPA